MENNIEFISASELPTTEAEEVDVLCVEGGELKRKAGASLGGSNSSTPDLVLHVYDEMAYAASASDFTVEWDYASVRTKLLNGEKVNARIHYRFTQDDLVNESWVDAISVGTTDANSETGSIYVCWLTPYDFTAEPAVPYRFNVLINASGTVEKIYKKS